MTKAILMDIITLQPDIRRTNSIGGSNIFKLKRVLTEHKITQKQLAKLLSVSQKTISVRLNSNNWSINDAEKVREFLEKKTIDEIFFERK